MEKPTITYIPFECFRVVSPGNDWLDDMEKMKAYADMIDALIECHEYIDIECKFQDDDNMKQVVCKLKKDIEQALTKAGVKL